MAAMRCSMEVAREIIPVMDVERPVTIKETVLREVQDPVVQPIAEILRRGCQGICPATISFTTSCTKERKGNFVHPIPVSH